MTKFSGLIATISLLVGCTDAANLSDVSKAGDEANFGQAENQLFWTFEQKVAGFRNMEKIAWARYVPAGGAIHIRYQEKKKISVESPSRMRMKSGLSKTMCSDRKSPDSLLLKMEQSSTNAMSWAIPRTRVGCHIR